MKLKVKNLNWLAGRPVVILGKETAKKLNVHVNDRIYLSAGGDKKAYAVVDIFSKMLSVDEIGLSAEISQILNTRSGKEIEVGTAEMFSGAMLIKKKMSGEHLTEEEVKSLVTEITNNNLTEAEIAYFVSAEKIKGMSLKEIVYLIKAMIKTGKKLNFHEKIVADKHCIGGIAGNRTTPIIVAICASAGLKMPKSSSRAITSASGTADVIETIANVELSLDEIRSVVNKTGGCLVWGGALGIAPSDDKIIRVERVLNLDVEPQLLASILAKKIAAGANRILIDIPFGGGKMKTKKDAISLGEKFKKIAKYFNIKVLPVYTLGDQPIGRGFGPVLEMRDVLSVLKNEPNCPHDLKKKSLLLAEKLMTLCGIKNASQKAKEILESGKAYEKFKEIINAQNKSKDFDARVSKLKIAKLTKSIYAEKSGEIIEINNQGINSVCRILGTPETISAGVYLHKHLGKIKKGDLLLSLYSESEERLEDASTFIKEFNPIKIK